MVTMLVKAHNKGFIGQVVDLCSKSDGYMVRD